MKPLCLLLCMVTAETQSSGGQRGASIEVAAVPGKSSPCAIQTTVAAEIRDAENHCAVQVTNQRSPSSAPTLPQVRLQIGFQASISSVYGTVAACVLTAASTNQEVRIRTGNIVALSGLNPLARSFDSNLRCEGAASGE
jgi:hypothetical protein